METQRELYFSCWQWLIRIWQRRANIFVRLIQPHEKKNKPSKTLPKALLWMTKTWESCWGWCCTEIVFSWSLRLNKISEGDPETPGEARSRHTKGILISCLLFFSLWENVDNRSDKELQLKIRGPGRKWPRCLAKVWPKHWWRTCKISQ